MNRVFIMGDIHGQYLPIEDLYNTLEEKPDRSDILILLGDFGGNYYLCGRDDKFKKKLDRFNFTYFIIRGNHEERPSICAENNSNFWHKETFFDGSVWVENNFSYIKYAEDGISVYQILGQRVLVVPGAYSVDKEYRLQRNLNWFPHEQLSEQEWSEGFETIVQNPNFNLVLSHTCPFSYMPTDLFLSCIDQGTVDKTTELNLEKIERSINYDLWCWGHYHEYRIYTGKERQMAMLFNERVIDYTKFFRNKNLFNSTIYIGR